MVMQHSTFMFTISVCSDVIASCLLIPDLMDDLNSFIKHGRRPFFLILPADTVS